MGPCEYINLSERTAVVGRSEQRVQEEVSGSQIERFCTDDEQDAVTIQMTRKRARQIRGAPKY
ncbi:hypothetical protein COMA2_160122 [Candidatus Nitrospira nitrificans]|uniref:Uncharacterized protein n=1 Tax=Candidatus Nitrospira nitrificans TaxID=1742973 RepID=A0A0S4LCV7_9BACT|nr:hypothetical protein COMA2_160122 [Candidatus Nitrospira nitrificans]